MGEDATSLSSAGLGVRIKMSEQMDLRVDHGWRLDDQGSQVHIGVQIHFLSGEGSPAFRKAFDLRKISFSKNFN